MSAKTTHSTYFPLKPVLPGRVALRTAAAGVALTFLAACGGSGMSDPRAQTLVTMSAPQHYAFRTLARELAGRCASYSYSEDLAKDMTRARVKASLPTSIESRGATQLEADIQRRSMAARYAAPSYAALDACQVLDGETARGAPVSVLVRKRG